MASTDRQSGIADPGARFSVSYPWIRQGANVMQLPRSHRGALIACLVALLACRTAAPIERSEPAVDNLPAIPASYVGLHIHYATTGTPWPSVPFASWRLW